LSKRLFFFLFILIVSLSAWWAIILPSPSLKRDLKEVLRFGRIKETIHIGVDNWIGYFPLCGQEMQKRMRNAGYRIQCEDDNADYPARMKALSQGKLDFAVATVDSFILNGAKEDFPGVMILVIDESKGGDAIVARKASFKSIEDLKNKQGYQVAFTPNSPSEHLLKSVSVHFEVPQLQSKSTDWKVETNGSSEALQKILSSKVDVAVLWEPDVSRAISNPEIVKILGTEDTHKLIVDILLVGRRFLIEAPEVTKLLLANYFRTLKYYREHPDALASEVVEKVKLPADKVAAMLKGVELMGLYENAANWFGVGTAGGLGYEGLTDTIESTIQILVSNGDFSSNPIPNKDPYRLQNRTFIKDLYEQGFSGDSGFEPEASKSPGDLDSLERKFSPLTEEQWKKLREIGTLKIRPVAFQSGTSDLDLGGKSELDKAAENLRHYPHFRVVVSGHTGLNGDPEANKILSDERAEAVKRYLMVTYNIDSNRLLALGLGAEKPVPRFPDETDRAYNYRLPRVELNLVSEAY
jgi:outer membrane protein OmpA-like peptidoglycan-associated protein/ABC-type amino acid transport substrate-binding protein